MLVNGSSSSFNNLISSLIPSINLCVSSCIHAIQRVGLWLCIVSGVGNLLGVSTYLRFALLLISLSFSKASSIASRTAFVLPNMICNLWFKFSGGTLSSSFHNRVLLYSVMYVSAACVLSLM